MSRSILKSASASVLHAAPRIFFVSRQSSSSCSGHATCNKIEGSNARRLMQPHLARCGKEKRKASTHPKAAPSSRRAVLAKRRRSCRLGTPVLPP
eukprot:21917-Rhodomonas_salina.1